MFFISSRRFSPFAIVLRVKLEGGWPNRRNRVIRVSSNKVKRSFDFPRFCQFALFVSHRLDNPLMILEANP